MRRRKFRRKRSTSWRINGRGLILPTLTESAPVMMSCNLAAMSPTITLSVHWHGFFFAKRLITAGCDYRIKSSAHSASERGRFDSSH